jgi:hypothetical protein
MDKEKARQHSAVMFIISLNGTDYRSQGIASGRIISYQAYTFGKKSKLGRTQSMTVTGEHFEMEVIHERWIDQNHSTYLPSSFLGPSAMLHPVP